MKIKRSKLVSVFVALGAKSAGAWNDDRLQQKIQSVGKLYENAVPEDEDTAKAARKLIKAVTNNEAVEIEDDGGEPARPAKTAAKKAAEAVGATEDEGDGGEVPADGGKKKGFPKKAGGTSGPGVIASLLEFLGKASAKKALTKPALLDKLCERFPDRDRDSMSKTVAVQIPGRLAKEKGVEVSGDSKAGFYIDVMPAGDLKTEKKKAAKAAA